MNPHLLGSASSLNKRFRGGRKKGLIVGCCKTRATKNDITAYLAVHPIQRGGMEEKREGGGREKMENVIRGINPHSFKRIPVAGAISSGICMRCKERIRRLTRIQERRATKQSSGHFGDSSEIKPAK